MTRLDLDHVTAVVAAADPAADALVRLLGTEPVAMIDLPGMTIRSFRVGDAEIHVNAPNGPGPVADHFRAHGTSYHHLAFRTEDLDATLSELGARGFSTLGTPIETSPGLREVFIDPRTAGGMLIQLVERRRVESAERYGLDGAAVQSLVDQIRDPAP